MSTEYPRISLTSYAALWALLNLAHSLTIAAVRRFSRVSLIDGEGAVLTNLSENC